MGELVTGRKPGRDRPDERTIACNLGIALDDIAVAPLIYERALTQGIGIGFRFELEGVVQYAKPLTAEDTEVHGGNR